MQYFDISEFDSPDAPGSGQHMDDNFLERLDTARGDAGIPFKINSGYRTESHNSRVGGKANSSHLTGYAADIHVAGSRERFLILDALLKAGFTRIGIANTFIHVDSDPSKSPNVIWTY